MVEGADRPVPRLASLVLFLTNLLTITLAGQRFFHALLFAGFQIKRMTLYFFNDVFRLNLAFKPPQRVFERLTFLHSNLCQGKYTSKSSQ
jgi:hypothetical protein